MVRLEAASRRLRREQTPAETLLWSRLRDRRFWGLKFRRQVPVGGHIADFLCEQKRLIVELDGSQHADQQEYDKKRTEVLEASGYIVVRFWNNAVLSDIEGALETLRSAIY